MELDLKALREECRLTIAHTPVGPSAPAEQAYLVLALINRLERAEAMNEMSADDQRACDKDLRTAAIEECIEVLHNIEMYRMTSDYLAEKLRELKGKTDGA